ncbi:MAG: sulfite reductase subunit A [Peptococcaceae bacterium BICA1-7]|nr:MAG: sulfite reductase subunit A [Peptococcaceae bacterium BICA1-7]HBV98230.1 anaerobic sulfite reductase subunit AsrA [Desulfotomaculum sp.]
MGYVLDGQSFDGLLSQLSKEYLIYAPVRISGKGAYSDTDLVAYGQISSLDEIEYNEKSRFSPKELIYPITQTLFYFTEDEYKEPAVSQKSIIIFCRPCDVHAFRRLDEIFLKNGDFRDSYYEAIRRKTVFFILECAGSFENCFCVSMGTNRVEGYAALLRPGEGQVTCDVDEHFAPLFARYGKPAGMTPRFIEENSISVILPEEIDKNIFDHQMWQEYSSRCTACGRCTVSCPTCSCFTMQDIFYEDNPRCGERRRVWASCMVDGFTELAGGHGFRKDNGSRMRFKVMHKIYDFRKRFGYDMCVGCGRCDDVCPEYISFSGCVNKVSSLAGEVKKDD